MKLTTIDKQHKFDKLNQEQNQRCTIIFTYYMFIKCYKYLPGIYLSVLCFRDPRVKSTFYDAPCIRVKQIDYKKPLKLSPYNIDVLYTKIYWACEKNNNYKNTTLFLRLSHAMRELGMRNVWNSWQCMRRKPARKILVRNVGQPTVACRELGFVTVCQPESEGGGPYVYARWNVARCREPKCRILRVATVKGLLVGYLWCGRP